MKNNLNLILPLLRFDLGSYHVQVMQRSKDGHSRATYLVAEWFITSEEKLKFLMPAIESLCVGYNARCYINLNPKSGEQVSWKIAESIVERLKTQAYNALSILSHAHDSCNGNGLKYWVIDVDDPSISLVELEHKINNFCDPGDTVVLTLETKTGYHIITKPFNLTQLSLPTGVEIKKNASTILFCL